MQNEVTFQAAGVVEVDSPRRRRTQLGGGAHRKAAAWTRSGPNAPPIGFTSSGASLSVPALDSGSCSAGLIIVPPGHDVVDTVQERLIQDEGREDRQQQLPVDEFVGRPATANRCV